MKNIFSVDVEDWFHILGLKKPPPIESWGNLESRIKNNFYTLLDMFDKNNTKVTCFFLGWVAENFPELVKEACSRGHEIASHGYAHLLVYKQTRKEFFEDILKTKILLEDISGEEVIGYRAPGFSITESTEWAFSEIARAGYKYDSSLFPASREHGGIKKKLIFPHTIYTEYGSIKEFPISVKEILYKRICFFGGGYLRLFPYKIINHMTKAVNSDNRPVIYYIHPRDIDYYQPKLPMGWKKKFKSYFNIYSTQSKINKLLTNQQVTSFKRWLIEYENS